MLALNKLLGIRLHLPSLFLVSFFFFFSYILIFVSIDFSSVFALGKVKDY